MLNLVQTTISYILQPGKRRLINLAKGLSSLKGLEIGGPSALFSLRGYFPIYVFAKLMDGVNFSNDTVWEGKLKEGNTYDYFPNKIGHQYIAEATDLSKINNGTYDFVLSCHSLEHVANPIKALKEWYRILKSKAPLILVLPDKEFTFDINRPYTTIQHLIADYQNNTDERDPTHFAEIMQLHDLTNDKGVTSKQELQMRTSNNFENRCVHHHVFSLELIRELLNYCGFTVIYQQKGHPFHLITYAEKKEK